MVTSPLPNLDTDMWIEDGKRVAGVEMGRLHNTWVTAPYGVKPSPLGGFAWTAAFVCLDEPDGSPLREILYEGRAETRDGARKAIFDILTKRMNEVVDHRKNMIAAERALVHYRATTPWWIRFVHRVRVRLGLTRGLPPEARK